MKITIRYVNGDVGEYEATQAEIDKGFSDGYFRFVRYGPVECIPVESVLVLSFAESDALARGFTRK